MISYLLSKELKDANFPQDGDGYACYIPSRPLEANETAFFIPWFQYILSVENIHPGVVYVPTLAELIKECGYNGFVMWEFEGSFYAGIYPWADRSAEHYDDWPTMHKGESPDLAVANLYLWKCKQNHTLMRSEVPHETIKNLFEN